MRTNYSIPICWVETDRCVLNAYSLEQAIHTVREMIRKGYLTGDNALPETVTINCGDYDENTSDEEIAKRLLQSYNNEDITGYYENGKCKR